MVQDKQQNENKSENVSESKKWVNATIGILLLTLRIIGATNQTFVGRFLTYTLGYAFGLFYPVFRTVVGLYGLLLIYAKKGLSFKNHARTWIGGTLLFLSILAFGSFSIFANDESVTISSLNLTYNDRMLSFARYPFQVDNFNALSGLGGGYVGLFLVTLFGAIWKAPGDIVFFIFLLLGSLFLLLFHPVLNEIENLKRKKAKRVDYSSSFRSEKNKEHAFLHRSGEKKPMEEEEEPLPQFDRSSSDKKPDIQAKAKETELKPVTKDERKPILDALNEKKPSPRESAPVYQESEEERRNQAARFRQAVLKFQQNEANANKASSSNAAPSLEKEPAMEPRREEKPNPFRMFATPSMEEKQPSISLKPEERKSSPAPMANSEPVPSYAKPSKGNPLDGPFLSRKDAYKEIRSQEISIQDDQPSQDAPERIPTPQPSIRPPSRGGEKERTEEEKEDEIVKQYFADKHQRESNRLEERKRKQRMKKAQLDEYSKQTLAYNYPFPTDELLDEHDDSAKIQINQEAARKKAAIINNALKDFGIRARATSFTIGASVTRFNVLTDSGEKADKIASLTDDLQRYLNGDKSVRVETVVEGRSTSGIEVGNQAPMAVSFKDVFQKVETNTTDNLLLPIGKDISGEIVTYPLNKRPHLLVAGSTGSGKSVLIHSRIATLLMRNYPNQMKLRLIDPKQVEFGLYKDCPHLLCPVISNPGQAIRALSKLCVERDRRFSLLSANRCVNRDDYVKLRVASPQLGLEERPSIVCIIDEFADLRQTGGKELPEYVCRIAQKARAAGIYLIIATQRPDRDVVPSLIKSNIACRIGLRCASRVNSQVILDENGAETLLGKGDLLFKCPGKKSRIRCQSPYLSNEEIDRILSYLKQHAGQPHYNPEFLDLEPAEKENALGTDGQVQDPDEFIYNSVKDFVCRTKRCNKALLRRTFRLTSQKAGDTISRLLAERRIDRGPGGIYTPGIAAEEYLQEHSN